MWKKNKNIIPHSGEIYLYNSFFTPAESTEIFTRLLETMEWNPGSLVTTEDRTINYSPRTVRYSNPGKPGTYPAGYNEPLPWTDLLLDIKQFVEDRLNLEFNDALVHVTHNMPSSSGWQNDEVSGPEIIPSTGLLSFGVSRNFQVKQKGFPGIMISAPLQNGSLLLVSGESRANWLYRFTESSPCGIPGINIIFRKIK